jgi:hypothetical protein
MQPQQPEPQSPGFEPLEPQPQGYGALESQPLNAAGQAYVVTAVVMTVICLSVLTLLFSGLWHAPLLAWPGVLLAYVRMKLVEMPKVAYGGLAVAGVILILALWFALRRARNLPEFVGERPDGTAGKGVLYFLRDFTIGVVVAILELISG